MWLTGLEVAGFMIVLKGDVIGTGRVKDVANDVAIAVLSAYFPVALYGLGTT